MIKLLFKYLIPLGLTLAILLVGYNYFLGTPAEQQQSQQIIAKFQDLGSDVFNLLHTEKDKYDAGKFSDALDKISSSISFLKEQASSATEGGQQLLEQLRSLDQQKSALESQIADLTGPENPGVRMRAAGTPDREQANLTDNSVLIEELGARLEKLAADTQKIGIAFGRQ